ncbi:unnamed protein product [Effrenium voratum]|nr:unnamed protein product [Effrenium voratum]
MGAEAAAKPAGEVAKPVKKPRLDCIDGCRFALVFPIVIAHFARFGTKNLTLLKLLTQENVLVGGFFVISGYVSAYTSTKLGARGAEEKKLANPELFFWQRVMAYYPLHFVSSAIFAPMFIWAERQFNATWKMIAFRAFLNFSMLQAWFPKEAEIWNQPTWFLSALTFSNLTMPTFVLPQVAALSKTGLHKLFLALTGVSLLQKVSYSETARFHSSKEHPVDGKVMMPLIWNLTRFHPFWALMEMTMGIVACRDVMLDTEEDKKKQPSNPLWLFLAAYASLALRLTKFDFNDAIIRGVLFVPIFTKFLTAMHRDALSKSPAWSGRADLLQEGDRKEIVGCTHAHQLLPVLPCNLPRAQPPGQRILREEQERGSARWEGCTVFGKTDGGHVARQRLDFASGWRYNEPGRALLMLRSRRLHFDSWCVRLSDRKRSRSHFLTL